MAVEFISAYSMTQAKHHKIMLFLWLLTMVTIPFLSIFGRPLQKWIFIQLGTTQVAALLEATLFLLCLSIAYYMLKTGGKKRLCHFLWSAPLLLIILLTTQSVVELSHVILFGLFGFLSLRLFPLTFGIVLCITIAGLDELLQFYLADRVGDWQDVFLNLMSTGLGGIWAFLAQKHIKR